MQWVATYSAKPYKHLRLVLAFKGQWDGTLVPGLVSFRATLTFKPVAELHVLAMCPLVRLEIGEHS